MASVIFFSLNPSAYTSLNADTKSLSSANLSIIWSNDSQAISTGFNGGPAACSARVPARPSQNWTKLYAALYTVGALTPPNCPPTPSEYCLLSTPPVSNPWQLAHDTVLSADKRVSWYNKLPRTTLRTSTAIESAMGRMGSLANSGATVMSVYIPIRWLFTQFSATSFFASLKEAPQCTR